MYHNSIHIQFKYTNNLLNVNKKISKTNEKLLNIKPNMPPNKYN